MTKYTTVDVFNVKRETAKAFKLKFVSDLSTKWVPKSVIEDPDALEVGDVDIEVNIASWFCKQEDIE